MMTLSEYLEAKGITQAEFARRINTSQAHVSRLSGDGVPSLKMALRIQAATSGEVPVEAWRSALSSEGV
jgi:transcriptional regulator with XRE-family HTH domain